MRTSLLSATLNAASPSQTGIALPDTSDISRLIHGVYVTTSPRTAVMEASSQHPLKVLWPAQMLASASPVNKPQGDDCGIYSPTACTRCRAG